MKQELPPTVSTTETPNPDFAPRFSRSPLAAVSASRRVINACREEQLAKMYTEIEAGKFVLANLSVSALELI